MARKGRQEDDQTVDQPDIRRIQQGTLDTATDVDEKSPQTNKGVVWRGRLQGPLAGGKQQRDGRCGFEGADDREDFPPEPSRQSEVSRRGYIHAERVAGQVQRGVEGVGDRCMVDSKCHCNYPTVPSATAVPVALTVFVVDPSLIGGSSIVGPSAAAGSLLANASISFCFAFFARAAAVRPCFRVLVAMLRFSTVSRAVYSSFSLSVASFAVGFGGGGGGGGMPSASASMVSILARFLVLVETGASSLVGILGTVLLFCRVCDDCGVGGWDWVEDALLGVGPSGGGAIVVWSDVDWFRGGTTGGCGASIGVTDRLGVAALLFGATPLNLTMSASKKKSLDSTTPEPQTPTPAKRNSRTSTKTTTAMAAPATNKQSSGGRKQPGGPKDKEKEEQAAKKREAEEEDKRAKDEDNLLGFNTLRRILPAEYIDDLKNEKKVDTWKGGARALCGLIAIHAPYTPASVRKQLYALIESPHLFKNSRENSDLSDYFFNCMQYQWEGFQAATFSKKDAFMRSEAGERCKEMLAQAKDRKKEVEPAYRLCTDSRGETVQKTLCLPSDLMPGFCPITSPLDLLFFEDCIGQECTTYHIVDWNRRAISFCEDDSDNPSYSVGWITGPHSEFWLQYLVNMDLSAEVVVVMNELAGTNPKISKSKESRLGEVFWRNRGEVPDGVKLPKIRGWENRSSFFNTTVTRTPDPKMRMSSNAIHHYLFDQGDYDRIIDKSKAAGLYEFGRGTKDEPFSKIDKQPVRIDSSSDAEGGSGVGMPEIDISGIVDQITTENPDFFNSQEASQNEAVEERVDRFVNSIGDIEIAHSLSQPDTREAMVSFFKVMSKPIGVHVDDISRLIATSTLEGQYNLFCSFVRTGQFVMAKLATFLQDEIARNDNMIADATAEIQKLERVKKSIENASDTGREQERQLAELEEKRKRLLREEQERRYGKKTTINIDSSDDDRTSSRPSHLLSFAHKKSVRPEPLSALSIPAAGARVPLSTSKPTRTMTPSPFTGPVTSESITPVRPLAPGPTHVWVQYPNGFGQWELPPGLTVIQHGNRDRKESRRHKRSKKYESSSDSGSDSDSDSLGSDDGLSSSSESERSRRRRRRKSKSSKRHKSSKGSKKKSSRGKSSNRDIKKEEESESEGGGRVGQKRAGDNHERPRGVKRNKLKDDNDEDFDFGEDGDEFTRELAKAAEGVEDELRNKEKDEEYAEDLDRIVDTPPLTQQPPVGGSVGSDVVMLSPLPPAGPSMSAPIAPVAPKDVEAATPSQRKPIKIPDDSRRKPNDVQGWMSGVAGSKGAAGGSAKAGTAGVGNNGGTGGMFSGGNSGGTGGMFSGGNSGGTGGMFGGGSSGPATSGASHGAGKGGVEPGPSK
ncbi:hypothetical protein BJ508DRAFT_311386 [Ascobolus immersus RN42]|uniref:Uncharacterized protein n=1 Tax=Ascobolus immersus RN42 TaxID=1160509 RepID=A0A3N4HSU2_ASCIM|nr:hypothetical protein BJ508DRAFT_311386 [Ascobolus immersus RN42]